MARTRKRKNKNSNIYKIEEDKGGVLKYKDILKPGPKEIGAKSEMEKCKTDDVVAKADLMVGSKDLNAMVEKGCVASAKHSLRPEAIGGSRKARQPSASSLREKIPVARASSSVLPSGCGSTYRRMMVGITKPKPTATHVEAVGSATNT